MKLFNAKCKAQNIHTFYKKDAVVLPMLNRSRTPLYKGKDVLKIKKSLVSGYKMKSPVKLNTDVIGGVIDTKEMVRNVIKKRLGSFNRHNMYGVNTSSNNINISVYSKGNSNMSCNSGSTCAIKGFNKKYKPNTESYVIKCSNVVNGNEMVNKQKCITTNTNTNTATYTNNDNMNFTIKHIQGKYLTLSKDNNSNNSRNSSTTNNNNNISMLSNKSSTSSIQSKISKVIDYSDELESSESEDDNTYI